MEGLRITLGERGRYMERGRERERQIDVGSGESMRNLEKERAKRQRLLLLNQVPQ